MTPLVIAIGGPTASGKTALSIELAQIVHTEIINADSRQVYRELNIGVARPSEAELQSIPHHFIATQSIQAPVNAGSYARLARPVLENILDKKGIVIVCGGTGLYIKSLLYGLDEMPEIPQSVKQEVAVLYQMGGLPAIADALLQLDPNIGNAVDLKNPMRVIRALELVKTTGKSMESIRGETKGRQNEFPILNYFLNPERKLLYERIETRCDWMIDNGFIQEAEALSEFKDLQALQTLGYKEYYEYKAKGLEIEKFREIFKQHTRNYAKRQVTWFKNQGNYKPIDLQNALNTIFADLKQYGHHFHP